MKKMELTVSMKPERLDALRYLFTARNKRTPQVEFQRALEELYEIYVPAETRAYLDTKCRPNRPHPRRIAARTIRQQSAESLDGSGSAQ